MDSHPTLLLPARWPAGLSRVVQGWLFWDFGPSIGCTDWRPSRWPVQARPDTHWLRAGMCAEVARREHSAPEAEDQLVEGSRRKASGFPSSAVAKCSLKVCHDNGSIAD